jgi:endogenous inhibitor of DNA gyrase (YacG/DUF329 family)
MSAALMVNCPQCKQAVLYSTSNPYRPFCSERCKQLDFGAWASESFRVPVQEPTDPDEPLSDTRTTH